jgi:predicted metal-binding membrane protein
MGPIMNGATMYSKTSLGSDQIAGGRRLSRRGKRIVFAVLGSVLAAGLAFGVWSAVAEDQYGPSANGCVNVQIPNTMGGATVHKCGADAVAFCRTAYVSTDQLSLLGRPQCELAGLTRARVSAG